MSSPPVTPPTLRGPSGVGGGGGFLSFATRLTTTTTTTMTNNSIVHETMSEPAYGRSLQFPPETAFSRDQGGVREQDDFLSQQQLQQLQYQQVGLSQPQQEPLWLQEQHQHELPQLSIESNPALTMPEKVLKERRDAELQAANAIHNAKVQAIDLKYTRELLSMRAQLQNQNALYTTPIGLGQTTGRRAGTPVAGALQVLCRSALTALSATAVNPQIGLSPVRTVNGRGEQSNPSIMDTVPMPPPPQSQSQYPVAGAIALASSPPPPTPTSILSSFPERTEESRGPAALSKPTLKPMDEIPEGKHANPSSYTVIGKRYAWTPELLGSGRYARVFGCLDLQNGSRKLAMRIVMKPKGKNETPPEYEMKKEVALMLRLKHRNIIQLHEFFYCEKRWYMVLERCKSVLVEVVIGCPECQMLDRPILHHNCRSKIFSEERCRDIFKQMVLGIEYLHAHGAIHRDIKPGNLLLTEDDVLKICDFGISQVFPNGGEVTIDGKLGTRVFMAPEFSAGSDAIPTDIWSMGVTLYVMAYGELPFPISNKKPHYDKFRNQEGDDTDTHLWSLIKRLLEHNPTARISMDRLREDRWLTNDGLSPLPSTEDNIGDKIVVTDQEIRSAVVEALVSKAIDRFKEGARRRAQNSSKGSGPPSSSETSHTHEASDELRMGWDYHDMDPRRGEDDFALERSIYPKH